MVKQHTSDQNEVVKRRKTLSLHQVMADIDPVAMYVYQVIANTDPISAHHVIANTGTISGHS